MALTMKQKPLVAFMLLELFEDGFKRGKNKQWLRGRAQKGLFTARYIHSDQFAEMLNAIEPDISTQSDNGVQQTWPCFLLADQDIFVFINNH